MSNLINEIKNAQILAGEEAVIASLKEKGLISKEQELINEGYKTGKRSFESVAGEILKSFDFKSVHKAMVALNWCWSFGEDEEGFSRMGIPDLDYIKRSAYKKLKHAYETKHSISSGGFTAGWDGDVLYLVFTLEEYSTNGYSL